MGEAAHQTFLSVTAEIQALFTQPLDSALLFVINCKMLHLSLSFSSHVPLLSVCECWVMLCSSLAELLCSEALHILLLLVTHSEAKCQWLQDAQHLSGVVVLLLKESKLPFPYDSVCDFNQYDRTLFKNTYYF